MGGCGALEDGALTWVLDTSFLIDISKEMIWASLAKKNIDNRDMPTPTILVPEGVEREYNHNRKIGKTDDFGIPIPFDGIESLLGVDSVSVYRKRLNEALSAKLDEEPPNTHKPRPLTKTDKGIVQAAVECAEEGKPVAVASADKGIVDRLDRIAWEQNLSIDTYSPWRAPKRDELRPLNIRILVTSNVFGELYHANPKDNSIRYLMVAKDMYVGGDVVYDIAFAVHTEKSVLDQNPKIDGVYLVPITFLQFEGKNLKFKIHYLDFFVHKIGALYSHDYPTVMVIAEHKNPITLAYKLNLIARGKNRELLDWNPQSLFEITGQTFVEWARVEERYLQFFGRGTVGKLHTLRQYSLSRQKA